MSAKPRSRTHTTLLLCLYGLLCATEWLCSKARERIELMLFPPKEPTPP